MISKSVSRSFFEGEAFVVEHPPPFQKHGEPADRERREDHEDGENFPTIQGEHRAEDDEGEQRKKDVERRRHQEALHAPVIADALHDVARGAALEKRDGQAELLAEKIGDHRDAHARADVQQQPASDHVRDGLAERKHELRGEQHVDEFQVEIADAVIDHGLREKGEDQLDAEADEHAEQHLHEQAFVRAEVVEKKREAARVGVRVVAARGALLVGGGRDFEQQVNAGRVFHERRPGRGAGADEFGVRVVDEAVRGIGDADFFARDFADDDEVIVFPMRDARERRFVAQTLEAEAHGERAQAEALGGLGDAEEIHAAPADLAKFAQALLRKVASEMRADHAQRGGPAVHRVELCVEGEAGAHAAGNPKQKTNRIGTKKQEGR